MNLKAYHFGCSKQFFNSLGFVNVEIMWKAIPWISERCDVSWWYISRSSWVHCFLKMHTIDQWLTFEYNQRVRFSLKRLISFVVLFLVSCVTCELMSRVKHVYSGDWLKLVFCSCWVWLKLLSVDFFVACLMLMLL